MRLIRQNGCLYAQFELLQPYFADVIAGVSAREGGVSSGAFESLNTGYLSGDQIDLVAVNRNRFCKSIGVDYNKVAYSKQIHSSKMIHVQTPGFQGEGDGLITDIPDVFLSVVVADCIPVFFYDPGIHVVGLLHAGWKGIAAGIVSKGIESLLSTLKVRVENVLVGLGPHIRSCCYTVTEELSDIFHGRHVVRMNDETLSLDLTAHVKEQLMKSGVVSSHIESNGYCTSCEKDYFFSFRRDKGHTGRMMAVIGQFY